MKDYQQLRLEVEKTLQELEIWKGKPKALYLPAVYALGQGGKRIRPVLALMACQLFGKDSDIAMMPVVGLEVFHNFTLLHDDVMDNAAVRHGMPTVHVKWNADTAILSGDAMFAAAVSLVAKAPQACLPAVLDAFNRLALGVCEGQQYDMNFETQASVSMAEYMEMIRLKTAVLIAGSLEIGALVAGASEEDVRHLYAYGNKIGLAFQLQDDWLDLYADEAKFGKKLGGDIRENKKTYLCIRALEKLQEEDKAKLERAFATPTTPENESSKIAEVKALFEKAEAPQDCRSAVNRLFSEAGAELDALSKTDPAALQELKAFTARLLGREY